MLLSEFKEYLSYGELSQVESGKLLEDNTYLPKLISHVNLGLVELYKRFPIKMSEVVIQLNSAITDYYIHSSKAETNVGLGDPADFYVKDSVSDPFKDDIIQVEQVFNEIGEELPLNDNTNDYSLFMVNHNVIRHPYPDDSNIIVVLYRGLPSKLPLNSVESVEIDLPQQFTEALLNFVSYRVFAGMNMNTAESVNYYAKFEASCALINNLGLHMKVDNKLDKITENGWV